MTGPRVVDQICPDVAGGIGNVGPPGVNTDHQIRIGLADGCDERHHPALFLAGAHFGPRACLDPADVDRVGTVGHRTRDCGQGHLVVEKAAGIVEGVGGAVDDGQQGRLARGERAAAQMEVSTVGNVGRHDTIIS